VKYESEVITPKGDIIVYDAVAAPVIENNSVKSVIIIARDITNRRKSEESLQENEENYSTLFHNSNDSIFIHELNGDLLDVNNQALNLFGFTKNEILSQNIRNLHPSYALEKSKSVFQEISKTGFIKFEIDFKKKNNDIFSAEVSSSIYKMGDRNVIQGIIRDITKRKKSEEEIKKSKDYLQNVIDNTSEIIFTIDLNYKLCTWNKTAENIIGVKRKIIGVKRKQIVGKYLKQIAIFENPGQVKEYTQNIFQGKTGFLSDLTLNTLYGTQRYFSVSPSYIMDSSKNITEILFVCRDTTFEKDIHGKFDFGNSYMISESIISASLDIFKGLIKSKHPGLYIGRTIDDKVKNEFIGLKIKIIKLADDKSDDISIVSTLENLFKSIENFVIKNNNSIIFISRIDYLITNYSFESIMKFFYKINDLIQKHKSIFILRVNPSIISTQHLSILNEEFKKIPAQEIRNIQISKELFDMLRYIYKENMMSKIVNYSRIGREFSISKTTVKNRIESLLSYGLIFIKKLGKTKVLTITEKGKNILKK